MSSMIRLALMILAISSRLLTHATLWQRKEWRMDRLREHLRSEGFSRQLFGVLRPLLVVVAITLTIAIPAYETVFGDAALIVLAAFSIAQLLLRKQQYPVRTSKTVAVFAGTLVLCFVLLGILSIAIKAPWSHVLTVLLEPVAMLTAWLLLLPLDLWLKQRVMRKATVLRNTYRNATVVGITGSVGKTTTKELLAHILKDRPVICTPAYVNSEMGVSAWLLKELPKFDPEEEVIMIVEMGAYGAGEIRKLCTIAKPTMGVITFIGTQHIALFGSQEKLVDAKAELVESLPDDGRAFLNGDNARCVSLNERCICPVTIVGTGGHADLEAFDIEETGEGIRFRVNETLFSVPLHGTHNGTNILLAIAVAEALGMKRPDIARKLESYVAPHHTFAVRRENGVTVLDDTHNASPESFRAAIAWAKSQPMHCKVLLTPGLIELGIEEDRIHRELGTHAKEVFSRVIFTGRHGRSPFEQGYGSPVELFGPRSVAIHNGDMLACIGRVHPDIIRSLLPAE